MMKQQRIFSSLLVLCLLSPFAVAGNNLSDWNNVRILEIGTRVVVKTKAGEKYEGDLKRATADSMTIVIQDPYSTRQTIDLKKDEVKEIRTKLSRIASTLIGTGAGLGAGVAIGASFDAKYKSSEDPGLGKIVFGFLGLVFGTAVGTRLKFNGKKIYQA
ncbi:MAG: hypothetical protein WBV94_07875 [Blastocatellia bacterium]